MPARFRRHSERTDCPPLLLNREADSNGANVMNDDTAIIEPTSTSTTSQTEPGVVAGISSARGGPDQTLSIRTTGRGIGAWRMLLMLGAGTALGYGVCRLWQGRGAIS